jgi:hypothetical protein
MNRRRGGLSRNVADVPESGLACYFHRKFPEN